MASEEEPRSGRGSAGGRSEQKISAEGRSQVKGVTQITGDVFQIFVGASFDLKSRIRIREFESLVRERTSNFLGRAFVFRAIDQLLDSTMFPSGYILVRGEPGIGKTTLLSQLVKTRGYVHHFNIAPQNIRTPRAFLENVCAQLIVRYGLLHPTLPPEAVEDSAFLSQLLTEAAEKAAPEAIVVLVDALDEAEDTGLPPSVNRLFLPVSLPPNVFFILTSREQMDYRIVVDRREDIYIRDDDPQNLDDVRRYVEDYLKTRSHEMVPRIAAWSVSDEDFIRLITEKSQGNFMYLIHVLNDIRKGVLSRETVNNVADLPIGLRAYYARHWGIMRAQDKDRFERLYEPILRLLATVREPVSISAIEEWSKIDPARIREVVRDWRPFLNEERSLDGVSRYRIYHASFQDYLSEEGVGLKPYHVIIAESALKKIPGFASKREP